MKRGIAIFVAAVLAGFVPPRAVAALTVREATAGLGYAATSVNGAVFRGGSLTSLSNTQYIAYYDADGYVVLGKRELGDATFTTNRTIHTGNIKDGHNVISIVVDGDGYIHASFDHHGHPLRYARSIAPGSLVLGEKEQMVGTNESNVTYPEFHRLSDGSLIFFYRDGASGNGNLVLNRYDLSTRKWSRVQTVLIDGENSRNAYPQMCVGRDDSIHVSWVWRETSDVSTNHDICYAVSRDGGKTWEKSDGTAYALPITLSTAEVVCSVAQNSSLMNQTSMTTMPDGRPVIATYWKASGDAAPQYRLVYKASDGTWKSRTVGSRTLDFSLGGWGTKRIPISRPQVVCDSQRMMVIVRDEERGSKVTLYSSTPTDAGEWSVRDLTSYAVNAWEPSYDRELWKERGWLDIYVQDMEQGDGEVTTAKAPTLVRVLELSAAPVVTSVAEAASRTSAEMTVDVADLAAAYGVDLAGAADAPRIGVFVSADGGAAVSGNPDANGVVTLSWKKKSSVLVQEVAVQVCVDGIKVADGTDMRVVCPNAALFDAVEPSCGVWTAPEGGFAVADGESAKVWGPSDGSPAQFALASPVVEKKIVTLDVCCTWPSTEELPQIPSSGEGVSFACIDGEMHVWTAGCWRRLEGATIEDDEMARLHLEIDLTRRRMRCRILDGGVFRTLASEGSPYLPLSIESVSSIAVAGSTRFSRLDGTRLLRTGREGEGFRISIR